MIKSIKQFKEKLYFLITKKDKKDIRDVLILGFIVGLFELVGLALIVLMIQVFTNTDLITSNTVFKYIHINLANTNINTFFIILSIIIVLFYILKLLVSLINAKKMASLISNLYLDISKKLFDNYLNYYYNDISKKNTAEINQMLVLESDNLSLLISNILYMIIHIGIIIMLYIYILYIDLVLTLELTIVLFLFAILYKKYIGHKLKSLGDERITALRVYMKLIKSTFSNYKFIKSLDGSYINENLRESTNNFKNTRIDMLYWNETPRLILEFIIIFLMISIVLIIQFKYDNSNEFLVIISAYAITLFRMLPSFSRILNGINQINQYSKTLDLIHTEFSYQKELNEDKYIPKFEKNIRLNNISYSYSFTDKDTLSNISLEIEKGDKIAITGESGSGKSTLLDILIGLHIPTNGEFLIDGIELKENGISSWRKKTSFVPQKVVLFDSTVRENITFGKEYDEKLFKEVLEDVFMYETVMLKGGYEAKVGDEVSGFSGGQMQRLAFARALYQERDILFLDEATSALDEEVEIKIIDNLLNKYREKTIISIVHKESIAKRFNKIVKIENGKIINENY